MVTRAEACQRFFTELLGLGETELRAAYVAERARVESELRFAADQGVSLLELGVRLVCELPTPPLPMVASDYREWLRTVHTKLEAVGSTLSHNAAAQLAFVEAMSGRTDEALQRVEGALEGVRGSRSLLVVRLQRRLARLAMDAGQVFLAQAAAAEATTIANDLGSRSEMAECLLLQANVEHSAFADPERALDRLASEQASASSGNIRGRLQLTKGQCCLDLGHAALADEILGSIERTENQLSFLNVYHDLFSMLLPLERVRN